MSEQTTLIIGAALGSQDLKEGGKGLGVAIADDTEESLAAAVDLIGKRHIFVPFAVRDFIDSDGGDVLKTAVFEAEIDGPFYRTADCVRCGVEAQAAASFQLRRLAHEARN
jgi:hypothetical protein